MIKVTANCSEGLITDDITDKPFAIGNSPHIVSKPTILRPSVGQISNNTVLIEWLQSIDSWGYTVNYSLYYSTDNGTNWYIIIENIGTTSFLWTFPPHDRFLLKVVAISEGGIKSEAVSGPYTFPESRIGMDSQFLIYTFVLLGISTIILSKRKTIKM